MNLNNGAHVMRADLNFEDPDLALGFVLARWHSDFVTWRVYRHADPDNGWETEHGRYFHFDPSDSASIANAEREAKADYRDRTG